MTFRTGRWTTRLCLAAASAALALWAAPAPAADSTSLIRKARKEVIEASIKAPTDPKAGSADLRRSVDAVDGIRLEPKVEPPPPLPELPQMPVIEPMPVMPLMPATENNPAGAAAISEAVVERLKNLAPDKVADPLGLADALYLGGRLPEASTFYERVLAATGTGAGAASSDTKAWALYQMANCRRSSDPAAAVTFYKRVAAEYPKSPWAGVSAVQQRLLEWYQTVGPTTSSGAKREAAVPATQKPAAEPAATEDAKNPAAEPAAAEDMKKPAAKPAAREAKKLSSGH
ncbi:MAG: tetratricopeptide repeat protein [Planctomycetota bacterium]|nr:tetratricopeptide repeat protein [Planctomycetota bacterium]